MLWDIITVGRDLGRLQEIASILIRYGFGDLVRRLGLGNFLERAGQTLHWKAPADLARLEPPERVREALQELGPTFVKFGQVLSTRADLFAPEWLAEFEKLQDRVPPVPFKDILPQLKEDLGASPKDVFRRFPKRPVAAASIAQVYRAELVDGARVAVKVRRPGIRTKVEADLRLLERLAEIAEAEAPEIRRYRPREMVRHFGMTLRRELDLASEARIAQRIAANFADDPDIIIPKIHWQWTCERLNVQEYVEGIPGNDLDAVDAAELDRQALATLGANAVLKMILLDGLYHADPHPGNVLYLPENRIAFLDFGMAGRLSEGRRNQLLLLLDAIVNQRAMGAVDVLLDWAGETTANLETLEAEVEGFVERYHGISLKQLRVASLLEDFTGLLRDNGLTLPPDLSVLIKALVTLEGLGRQLDPDFDMAAQSAPFVRQAMAARYAPDALLKRGQRAVQELAETFSNLPADLRGAFRAARRGKLQVNIDMARLERFGHQIDGAASRLTVGIVTAALIVGSAIVMTVDRGPTVFGLPVFGLLGFLAACVGGVWLLISIWRGKRDRPDRF